MEINYFEKLWKVLVSNGFSKLKKSLKLDDSQEIKNNPISFHIDCKFSKKKICQCKIGSSEFKTNQIENFNDFLNSLVKKEVKIKNSNEFAYEGVNPHKDSKLEIEKQRLKAIKYNDLKPTLKTYEDMNLTLGEFREVEKSINEDKKICENCKTNIYENNFHKGWKNENGEFVLLCPNCSKKYFNGALEIKFDNVKKIDNSDIINKPVTYSISKEPIEGKRFITTNTVNFATYNPNNPKPTFLTNKRLPNEEPEFSCSNKKCLKQGKKSDFIFCENCKKSYHFNCVDGTIIPKFVNGRFKWYCNSCKFCNICKGKNDLLKCSTCERGFHMNCYNMTLEPNNKYYCDDCLKCKNCLKKQIIINIYNQNDILMVKSYRVCEECWQFYKTKNYCPKCLKIKKGQNDMKSIYCSKCFYWYHEECENLTNEEKNLMAKSPKYSYTCKLCKAS